MNNAYELKTQLIDTFNFRHACKLFDSTRKISEADFSLILEAARLSPSSFGLEPWQLLIVQDQEARDKLKEHTWGANGVFHNTAGQLGTASHFIIILSHTAETMKHGSAYLEEFLKNTKQLPDDVIDFYKGVVEKFQKSDFELHSDREINEWTGKQAYIALANMMTAAAVMEIDTCPVEGFNRKEINKILCEEFNVDTKRYQAAVMLALGYRAQEPGHPKTRRTMDQIVQWI